MEITRNLLKKYFGPEARISGGRLGSFKVKMPSGASVRIASDGKMKKFRGSEIYAPAMRLMRDLFGSCTVSGNAQHVMLSALHGQPIGLEVNAEHKRSWFKPDPPPVPRVSGAHGDAKLASSADLRAAGLIAGVPGKGLRLGEDSAGNVIRYNRQCGISIIGPPRTGKGVLGVTMLVENEDASWLLADGKLEFLAITERRRKALGPVRKFVPFKEDLPDALKHHCDESDSYNRLFFMDPRSESYVIENDLLAGTVIVPDGENKEDGFFTEGAQSGVSFLNMFLVENMPDEANLPRMAEIAATNELFEIASLAMKIGSPAIKARAATFGDEHAREMKGGINDIVRTLRKGTKWLCDPAIKRVLSTPKNPWRFDDLKRGERPMTIYVGVPSKFQQPARGLMRLLFGCAASDLIGTAPGNWPVKLLADEFHTMGAIDIFSTGFSEGAGHGLAMIPIRQTAGQLVEVWGQQGYRAIQAGCELQIFLPPRDPQQAAEIETIAGTRSILTGSYSQGGRRGEAGNISIGETGMPVLDAHTAAGLGPDQMVINAPGLVKDIIIARRRPYWEYPEIARWCDPNPYAPGARQQNKTPVSGAGAAGEEMQDLIARLRRLGG